MTSLGFVRNPLQKSVYTFDSGKYQQKMLCDSDSVPNKKKVTIGVDSDSLDDKDHAPSNEKSVPSKANSHPSHFKSGSFDEK